MNSDDFSNVSPAFTLCEIPPLFQSLELDGLFQKCCLCEQELLSLQQPYSIERIFRGSEPIIEYAMCFRCRTGQQEQISKESLLRLQNYWDKRVDQHDRAAELVGKYLKDEITIDAWTDHCVLTGTPLEKCKNHQVVGLAFGDEMLLSYLPVMISDVAIEEIQKLLSEKTRGWMDDFISDQFGMPPEFLECPPMLV